MINAPTATVADPAFDYTAAAEFFPRRTGKFRHRPLAYRRFAEAAHAIRFAIEELPPELLLGSYLEVGEQRYDRDAIRCLYDSAEYPLARRSAVPA